MHCPSLEGEHQAHVVQLFPVHVNSFGIPRLHSLPDIHFLLALCKQQIAVFLRPKDLDETDYLLTHERRDALTVCTIESLLVSGEHGFETIEEGDVRGTAHARDPSQFFEHVMESEYQCELPELEPNVTQLDQQTLLYVVEQEQLWVDNLTLRRVLAQALVSLPQELHNLLHALEVAWEVSSDLLVGCGVVAVFFKELTKLWEVLLLGTFADLVDYY